jgi:DNA-binding LytR/AlgR family response regulator
LVAIEEIGYIKATGNYSQVFTKNNECYLHDKNLNKLLQILPKTFIRTHRSYVVPPNNIQKIIKQGGGKYSVQLGSGQVIPLSRDVYKVVFREF